MGDDYDTPWKEVVTQHFPDFLAFYFPAAHAAIDWSCPHAFLDQELAALSRDGALGKRLLDKLVSVVTRDGGPQWVLVHVELQGWQDRQFAERLFVYNYRTYDRFRRPVASLALLLDDGPRWRPQHFTYQLLGCKMVLEFPVVKLLDFAPRIEELKMESNPFALVTVAHLLASRTRHNAFRRRRAKWMLTKLLYQRDWDKQRIIDLYRMIDWLLRLPQGLDQRLQGALVHLERRGAMAYISSIERAGMETGRKEGRQEGRKEGQLEVLTEQLIQRFGPLASDVQARLTAADGHQLLAWARNFVHASTLEQVFHPQ